MFDASPSATPRRRRVQFTMRTFFAAAVLVSCFGVAAQLPSEAAKAIGLSFLASLTFAGLYWTFGGIGPLVALPVGTAVAGVCLGLTFPFAGGTQVEDIWIVVLICFVWGIAFSIVVVLSWLLWRLTKWCTGWFKRRRGGELPSDPDAIVGIRPLGYVKYVVVTRLLLAAVILLAALAFPQYSNGVPSILFVVSAYFDAPLIPLALEIYAPVGPNQNSIAVILFILVMSVVGCVLHGGTSWIVGWLVARIDRRRYSSRAMIDMNSKEYNGWTIRFRKNVHMYCHRLEVAKGSRRYEIPCEDLPLSDGLVAMWLHELDLDEATSQDLLKGLLEWAHSIGMKYRIYTTRTDFETNERGR